MTPARAKTQAKVMIAALAAVSLAACGTTVRHHAGASGSAGQLGAASSVSGDTSLDAPGTDGTTAAGGDSSTTGTAAGTTGTDGTGSATSTGTGTTTATGTSTASGTGTTTGTTGTSTSKGTSTTGTTTGTTGTTGTKTTGTKTTGTKTTGTKTTAPGATATTAAAEAPLPTGKATGSAVNVGIVYETDLGAASVQLGNSKATAGDMKQEAQAAIDYVNNHGGLYGHVLNPVYDPFELLSTAPYATTMQSICSAFTQDSKVALAMFVGASVPDALGSCLSQAGVAYMSAGAYLHDETTYSQITGMLSPSEATTTEVTKALIPTLLSSGWLTSGDKVGVLLGENEDAAVRAYNSVVLPTLKAKGISVASYPVDYPASTAAVTNTQNQVQSDQVQMKADGVTKVLMMAPGTVATFMKDADQQKYYPKYALTTWDSTTGLTGGGAPADELAGATGIGWEPVQDVGVYGTTAFDNSTTTLCKSIESPTGQVSGALSEYASNVYCTAILEVQAMAMKARAATITGGTLVAGYQALGSSFPDANTMTSNYGPVGGHAGAASYRPFSYGTACDCFTYTGGAVKFS